MLDHQPSTGFDKRMGFSEDKFLMKLIYGAILQSNKEIVLGFYYDTEHPTLHFVDFNHDFI